MFRKIGKVNNIQTERSFEWRIENFGSLRWNRSSESPTFSFAGQSWHFEINPNGQKGEDSFGYIGLYLRRESSGPPINQHYSLILKTVDEKIFEKRDYSFVFDDELNSWGTPCFLKRSIFFKKTSKLGLPATLIAICTMKHDGNADEAIENAAVKCSNCEKTSNATNISNSETKSLDEAIKCPMCRNLIKLRDWQDHECQKCSTGDESAPATCSNCKKTSDAANLPSPETKVLEETIKCPVCCNKIKLKDWHEHECQKGRPEALEKLSHDLKEMMKSGDNSDTVVSVKGKKLQLHRNILMTRNPYFHSMFKSDMKEKKTGTVTIDDCEPEIFSIFVYFLYTGKVDKLSSENVCELYETTDKYQEDQLKKDCLDFMMDTISEDTFCDYITLALKYDEKKLFEKCVEFLLSKPKDIVRSVKWQIFAKEYPTQANELIIKTLDHLVK